MTYTCQEFSEFVLTFAQLCLFGAAVMAFSASSKTRVALLSVVGACGTWSLLTHFDATVKATVPLGTETPARFTLMLEVVNVVVWIGATLLMIRAVWQRDRDEIRQPSTTSVLVLANVVVYLATAAWTQEPTHVADGLALHGALAGPALAQGHLWRIASSAFLHSGLLHLVSNMIALDACGEVLEKHAGRTRLMVVYGVSMLGCAFAWTLAGPVPALGASGAICGLLGAIVVMWRRYGLPVRPGVLVIVLAVTVALSVLVPGTAWQGHLGGFVAGMAVGAVLLLARTRAHVLCAALAALLLAATGIAAAALY